MCLAPIKKRMDSGKVETFPCGKCLECVKKYQNHWSMRLTEEYKDWNYGYFLTLTYSNDKLSYVPLKLDTTEYRETDKLKVYGNYKGRTYRIYDEELGQYLECLDLDATAEDRFQYVYNAISKMPLNSHLSRLRRNKDKEFVNYLIPDNIQDGIKVPVVSRSDVQLWLKRVRIAYKRATGNDMVFKYFLCSEYGPNTLRPHYHMMIFANDLSYFDIQKYFVEKWEDTYGRVDWTKKPIDSPRHVADYVAKYCLKPAEFENPYVVAGLIPRTFRLQSQGIGKTYKQNLMKSVFELQKEIPIYCDEVRDFVNTSLSDSVLHNNPSFVNPAFIEALYNKLQYYKEGFFYGMPRYWKDSVFPHTIKEGKRYNKNTKQIEKYERYEKDTEHNISVAYTEYVEARYLENLQKYEEIAKSEYPNGDDMVIQHYAEILYQQDLDARTKAGWQKLYKKYYGQSLKSEF